MVRMLAAAGAVLLFAFVASCGESADASLPDGHGGEGDRTEQTPDEDGNGDNQTDKTDPDDQEGQGDGQDGQTDPDDENNDREDRFDMKIKISRGGATFGATLDDSATGRAFAKLLPMTLKMTELNGNEKYCNLASPLPTSAYRPGTIESGDLMLWGSDCVVLFYATFSSGYSYTRIGRIDDPSGLAAAVGRGDITAAFE